jgi:Ca2+-binding EF-hand superfamily protein
VEEIFDAADMDASGALNKRELGVALRMMGVNVDRAQLGDLFSQLDFNGNGEVTAAEFLEYFGYLWVS